jgi:hypothetical protein
MTESEDITDPDPCSAEDGLVYTAAGLIVFGIICMVVGYVVPRDYTFNPYARARDMEAIEIYYADLSQNLDLTIVIGMAFIALGGMILSSFITYISCCESQTSVLTEASAISPSGGRTYGTSAGNSSEYSPRTCGGISNEPHPTRDSIELCER